MSLRSDSRCQTLHMFREILQRKSLLDLDTVYCVFSDLLPFEETLTRDTC